MSTSDLIIVFTVNYNPTSYLAACSFTHTHKWELTTPAATPPPRHFTIIYDKGEENFQ